MGEVYSKALDQSIEVDRIIGKIKGKEGGPTIIFTGGIHGNEPSGVFALSKVFEELSEKKEQVKGNIYGIAGNLWAMKNGERYHENDLNRLWTRDKMDLLKKGELPVTNKDVKEQIDIYETIEQILKTESGPFYFIDLHTTSSETIPFLTVNDSLLNRKFTQQFPVPIILGIEEFLDGPLLSYINELGYVAFGFEAGQHDDLTSIENHAAFIYLSLAFAGSLSKNHFDYDHYYSLLAKNTIDSREIYEIFFRYELVENDKFVMIPGFINFQKIHKNQLLAKNNRRKIFAKKKGRMFMPLYQSQGNDGFFIIRRIPPFILQLSAIIRRMKLDRIFLILPGVKWYYKDKRAMIVNRYIAMFSPKKIFHLFGYRSRELDKSHLVVYNREEAARNKDYLNTTWY